MTTPTNWINLQVAEKSTGSLNLLALLRWALATIFLWFGFIITLTFFLSTPGVAEPTAGGFPAISAVPGQFLLKDLVLLAASLSLLWASVQSPWLNIQKS
jgi:uncharacterized membrane protein YkgB